MKIFSFDAETNGLYGQAFAIGAVVTEDGKEIAKYFGRCQFDDPVDPWVEQNVIPALLGFYLTQFSYKDLLNEFFAFYAQHKEGADVIAHVAHPVETKLLRDMIELDLETRMWEGPFPLLDVAGILKVKGHNPNSVDEYLQSENLTVPFRGSEHHPLFDAYAAEVVYRSLMEND